MVKLTIRIPDDKHETLQCFAVAQGISTNKLIEELITIELTEFDAETRFKTMATQGNIEEGLSILDKLDKHLNKI